MIFNEKPASTFSRSYACNTDHRINSHRTLFENENRIDIEFNKIFAMSFGILGCHDLHGDGRPWLTVRDPACCAKTFPHFFGLLEDLRQNSLRA